MLNFNVPDLLNSTRKRRVLGDPLIDPTTGFPYNNTIPNDLPIPNNPMPIGSNIPQGGGKMEMLGRILQAAAAGASVGLSNDPAAALAQQLSQAAKERIQRQQMQAEKEAQQAQQQFQKEMQKSQQTHTTVEAQKDRAFKSSGQLSQNEFELMRQDRGFGNQKEMQQSDQQAREHIVKLTQEFESGEALKNKEFQTKQLELKQSGDLNGALARSVTGALMNSVAKGRMSMQSVIPIITKLNNGEALDKNDAAVLDHSIKSAAKVGVAKGAVTAKQVQAQQFKSENDYLNDERDLIKGLTTAQLQPRFNQFTGQAQPTPSAEELASTVGNAVQMYRQLTGRGQIHTQNPQGSTEMRNLDTALANTQIKTQDLMQAIDNNANMTPEDKKKAKDKVRANRGLMYK